MSNINRLLYADYRVLLATTPLQKSLVKLKHYYQIWHLEINLNPRAHNKFTFQGAANSANLIVLKYVKTKQNMETEGYTYLGVHFNNYNIFMLHLTYSNIKHKGMVWSL